MVRSLAFLLVFAFVSVQGAPLVSESAEMSPERVELSLKWRTKVIPIAISTSLLRSAPNVKSGSDLIGALRRSLRTWEEASGVEFREVFSDKQNVSPQGAAGDGVSLVTIAPTAENALLFGKNADEVAATTRVFFDSRGRISEADIVLNPYQQFSTDGTFGSFDAESTFAHEIGHVLGLDHSVVRGSVMYENFGKNGVFNLQSFSNRTLSEIDRSAIRVKYGSAFGEEKCCGTVAAKLQMPDGRGASNVEVWLEDSASGRVIAQAKTETDGSVVLSGIQFGKFNLFSGRKERAKRSIPAQELGEITVTSDDPVSVTKKLESASDDIDVKYTGFNGQLTFSAVPVNAGKSYTIYIGGKNLSPTATSISFSSPLLSVTTNTIVSQDYGSDISVLSFEVAADPNIPVGEYTIFVESPNGGRSAVVGGIAVRSFSNPFSNFILDSKIN